MDGGYATSPASAAARLLRPRAGATLGRPERRRARCRTLPLPAPARTPRHGTGGGLSLPLRGADRGA